MDNDGKLSLCGTPIGNLEDITFRAVRTLNEADCIYAEDTRHTIKLLNHLELKKPLFACHQHNEREGAAAIIKRVRLGEKVAYVSDAGMPGISDPGAILIEEAEAASIPYEIVPGPSAVTMAAALYGTDAARFAFIGFLPRESGERRELLLKLATFPMTMMIYESPLRVGATLTELYELWGERPAALMRELTKLHEQTRRGSLSTLSAEYSENAPKGECVIAVGGCVEGSLSLEEPEALLRRLLDEGMSIKNAVKQANAVLNIPRNEAYELALRLQKQADRP